MASADLLLHPVRLRIVQALLGDRELTTAALAAELSDVAPATLYRQIGLLLRGEVLRVASERRVRGAVERTYALDLVGAQMKPSELAAMTPEDHQKAFMAFVAGLLADFDRYLQRDDIDLVRDGVGYRQVPLWLTTGELGSLMQKMSEPLIEAASNGPQPGRERRLFTTVLMPT